ncbi:uncharacterized protein B0I36DRAFT_333151 [Microdochium trichocladiopsis]|uniref:Uncharacterized protein n=1 Tax=Microdochium trichocladiopsis TaxID=1682393 RepID=A0A9P8XVL9_9PEZI|nr:uncharacterized protein B0I36DRAFT_333151 [Microdochium trichocladiopsis]KAH7020766.1 hypothetical protein B0I36DRAFT_333151 [Microdochium trichocladiopsis]
MQPLPIATALNRAFLDLSAAADRHNANGAGSGGPSTQASTGLLRYPLAGFMVMLRAVTLMGGSNNTEMTGLRQGEAQLVSAEALQSAVWKRLLYLLIEEVVRSSKATSGSILHELIWKKTNKPQEHYEMLGDNELKYNGRSPELCVPLSKIEDSSLMSKYSLGLLQGSDEYLLLQQQLASTAGSRYSLGLFLHVLCRFVEDKIAPTSGLEKPAEVLPWPIFIEIINHASLRAVLEAPHTVGKAEVEQTLGQLYVGAGSDNELDLTDWVV